MSEIHIRLPPKSTRNISHLRDCSSMAINSFSFVPLSRQYTCMEQVAVGCKRDVLTFTTLDSDFPGYPFASMKASPSLDTKKEKGNQH